MAHFHHEAQLEEANKIRSQAENATGGRDSKGQQLGSFEGDGLDNIDKPIPAPVFQG